MKAYQPLLALAVAAMALSFRADACTNVIVSPGASVDGSSMVSYAADSHWLFGELYFRKAGNWKPGSRLAIYEWDSNKPLGDIAQVPSTFQTVGNMNVHQLIIGETTWGGREEQVDTNGVMDYGSLIYIALQRASTAREAIQVIVDLANEYGYPSEGESFSIADPKEAWVMDLVGKGSDNKGIVWVARRVPDGYICAHANQCRITRFPWNDPENCLYAPDVAEFARSKGWYSGSDEDFSFRDAYNPLDFGGARACDARAWAAFNILCDGQFTYEENGAEVTRPASDWLEYAMGYDMKGEM
nr:C69 family dipeptidase [Bacteroidales bacterium]